MFCCSGGSLSAWIEMKMILSIPRTISRAARVANAIQAGFVWINDYGTMPATVPFGGYKQSGNGREWGGYGIKEFLEVKSIFGYETA